MSNTTTSTQRTFTTTTTASTHPMAAANNDCFHSAPMFSKQYISSGNRDMVMTENGEQTQHREPFRNVSIQNATTAAASSFAPPPRHPALPPGQSRLRFVDCLAWMVNSLTEGQDHHHNHQQDTMENDKPMVWWSPDGQALYFRLDKEYEEQLSAAIRPYFKHGNFGSIRRQLFAYGFSKPLQGPNKKGFTHPYFKRGELTQENLKLIVRKIKGKQSTAAKDKLDDDEDNENDAPITTRTWYYEPSERMMSFKPTMKQQAEQLVKDLNSAAATTGDKNGIILSQRNPNHLKQTSSSITTTKQTKKATRVSLDQDMMTAEDLAAVAKLKSLRAIPHQSIIDGNYLQQLNNKENNISPRLPPLPNHHQQEKDAQLQPAPYVLYPSESGTGSVVKVTRDWYVQTIQNNKAANHCDVLVI